MQAGVCLLKISAATRFLVNRKTWQFTPLLGFRVCTSTAYLKFSTRVPSAPLFLPSRKINLDHLCSLSEAYMTQHLRGTPKFKVSRMHVGKNSSSLISCSDNREQGQGVACKVSWSPAAVFKLAWTGARLEPPHFWWSLNSWISYWTMTLNRTIVLLLTEMQQSSLIE